MSGDQGEAPRWPCTMQRSPHLDRDGGAARVRGRESVPGARLAALRDDGGAVRLAAMVAESKDAILPLLTRKRMSRRPRSRRSSRPASLPSSLEVEAQTPCDPRSPDDIPGLGPKRVRVLHKALRAYWIAVVDLLAAATGGNARELPRFSARSRADRRGDPKHQEAGASLQDLDRGDLAAGLVAHPARRRFPGRRRRRRGRDCPGGAEDQVGDLDILVTAQGQRGGDLGQLISWRWARFCGRDHAFTVTLRRVWVSVRVVHGELRAALPLLHRVEVPQHRARTLAQDGG